MSISKKFLFVGEKQSETARKNNWTWISGRLAAKQLFDCLRMIDIDPNDQQFTNLWTYDDQPIELSNPNNLPIVAMGRKVEMELKKNKIHHLFIYHPAARGKIRKKELYSRHLKETLG